MSELLERIRREIGERLEASRKAVLEHERLEAALDALSDAGSRATRAVTERGKSSRASEAPQRSSRAVKPSTRVRASKRAAATSGAEERAAGARAGDVASAPSGLASGAAAAGGAERSRPRAGGRPARVDGREGAGAVTSAPARKRAPRGANRAAVLRVIGERPGVTARELAAASQVTGGTLYTLLRRLTDEGTLEKRELPAGQAGYALAATGTAAQSADEQADTTTRTTAAAASPAAAGPAQEQADSTQTADAAPSGGTDTQRK